MTTHECPANGCQVQVPHDKLMCYTHWKMVPGKLGSQVYAAYAKGAGVGTPKHQAACAAAIAAVNRQLAESVS